jgi:hypothetical protein
LLHARQVDSDMDPFSIETVPPSGTAPVVTSSAGPRRRAGSPRRRRYPRASAYRLATASQSTTFQKAEM